MSRGRQGCDAVRFVLVVCVVYPWFVVCSGRTHQIGREEESSELCVQML